MKPRPGNVTYHIEGQHGINFDHPVEIAEQDGQGKKQDIGGVADIVAEELNELADKHPHHQRLHGANMGVHGPRLGGLMAEQEEQQITEQSGGRQGCQMNRVGAPRLAA